MHTPTKTQWQTVIDNLKKVLPMATREDQFNMHQYIVQRPARFTTPAVNPHVCGTVHCIGGWYTIAVCEIPYDRYVGFSLGANRMANDLGFENKFTLTQWANWNPKIWGNMHGSEMFGSATAYNGASTLAEAITYLEGVRDRSPESYNRDPANWLEA